MKILYLIPYNPVNPTFGGALRIYHLLEYLCKHHDVHVAGFSSPEQEEELIECFPSLKGKTHFMTDPYSEDLRRRSLYKSLFTRHSHWYAMSQSEKFQEILDEVLRSHQFDIIQSEFPVMAMYNYNDYDAIKIIDAHNVEYDNFKRMAKVRNPLKKIYYRIESYKFYKEEIEVCAKQNALFVTSERDIELFNQSIPDISKYLVPNGVDDKYFNPLPTVPKPYSIVFVGVMKYVPNYDGMNFFLDQVFPKILAKYPEATVTIVGSNPPKVISSRASKNIIVTGFVEDTRPYIQNASVYVVPLRMGGGTRLKILEALSMKIPLVTTSIGCEGIEVENRKSALIEDDPQKFADAVMELFADEDLYQSLIDNGHNLMKKKYRWSSIGERMDKAYEELLCFKPDSDGAGNGDRVQGIGPDTDEIYEVE